MKSAVRRKMYLCSFHFLVCLVVFCCFVVFFFLFPFFFPLFNCIQEKKVFHNKLRKSHFGNVDVVSDGKLICWCCYCSMWSKFADLDGCFYIMPHSVFLSHCVAVLKSVSTILLET